jgi:hypothetical protein
MLENEVSFIFVARRKCDYLCYTLSVPMFDRLILLFNPAASHR